LANSKKGVKLKKKIKKLKNKENKAIIIEQQKKNEKTNEKAKRWRCNFNHSLYNSFDCKQED
jgi:CRISPR/Cas system-associated endoribonuclease Cas2